MRPSVRMLVVVLALGACTTQREQAAPSPTVTLPSPSSPSASPSPAPSPVVDEDVELPPGFEPFIDDPTVVVAVDGGAREPLVPQGVSHTSFREGTWDPLEQVVVGWFDGFPDRRVGLVVWQRFDEHPTWRVVYAFFDPRSDGVLGIQLHHGDLTANGIPDLLSFEGRGGSGGCGTYRVIASADGDAEEIFRRDVCDTEITIAGGDLLIRAAVYEPDDPHCCPSAFRTTTLRWDGQGWERIATDLEPTGTS